MRQQESTETMRAETQTGARENAQLEAVWQAMRDGAWRSVEEIAALVECPPASASARLRDLRKPRYGGWNVERAYVGNGLWRYRVAEKASVAESGAGEAA